MRKQVVQELISQGFNLVRLQNIYTNQVILIKHLEASYGITGVKNNLVFSAFWRDSTSLTDSFGVTLPTALALNGNNKQVGGSASYGLTISPKSTMNVSLSRVTTTSNLATDNSRSVQSSLQVILTQRLSAQTSGSLGARYTNLDSSQSNGYIEHAIFATILHRF